MAIQPNNSCCQPVNGNDVGVDFDSICGGGWECPPKSVCMSGHWPGDAKELCACITAKNLQYRRKEGWIVKYPIARVDKPRLETAVIIPSPSPDHQSLIGLLNLSMPPRISKAIGGGGGNNPLPEPPPIGFVSTGDSLKTIFDYPYGRGSPIPKYWASWWPYGECDFPESECWRRHADQFWDEEAEQGFLREWYGYYETCSAPKPAGQGLSSTTSPTAMVCAAQKWRMAHYPYTEGDLFSEGDGTNRKQIQ